MAKPNKPQPKTPKAETPVIKAYTSASIDKKILLYSLIAFAVAFLTFANTIRHEYALDDLVSITQNRHTLSGFAGIKEILTKDSFNGYTQYVNLVSGGRYRPLAIITFAIEIGIWGHDIPHISHFGNVLLFAISMALLFLVCYRFIFKGKLIASAITTMLFIVHPLHTEVVANIKSRDEIMMLMFSLGAMYLFFEYLENKKKYWKLGVSGLLFFLAMMSKENAVMFIGFIPLVLYFIYNIDLKKAIKETWFLIVVTFIFIFIRFSITGFHSNLQNEILNAPYLWATPIEAFATKTYILLRYLALMVFPHPLSCLYTWNAIPYIGITDPKFLIAFVIYAGLIFFAFKGFFKRNMLAFFLINYLAMLMLVSNFIFDIGALMGERFLYQAGLPLIMAAGYYSDKLYAGNYSGILKTVTGIITVIIVLAYTARTIQRNSEWTNDDTIAIADRDTYECAHVKVNAASAFYRVSQKETDPKKKAQLVAQSKGYFTRAIAIYPTYTDAHLVCGACYYLSGNIDSAAYYWDKAREIRPNNDQLKTYFPVVAKAFYERAQKNLKENKTDSAAYNFKMAMRHDTLYYQIIRFYYDKAYEVFMKKDYKKAMTYLDTYLEFKTDNMNVFLLYGDACYNTGDYLKSREMYKRALPFNSENPAVLQQLKNIEILLSMQNKKNKQQ